jgi:hypothetical protein
VPLSLELLKMKTRLIDERFKSVMGESRCDRDSIGVSSIFKVSVVLKP